MISVNKFWVEKYRPTKIDDCILPEQMKSTFQQFVDQEFIPNLLLVGGPGVGKTTVAKAMIAQLGADFMIINGSMNGGIDTLRNEIQTYASSISFSGGRKYIILDEADYLTPNTQAALRNFMEEFSKNVSFILTCNFKNRIIEPLHSRCSVIDFKIDKQSLASLANKFMQRLMFILDSEKVEYEKPVLAEMIKKFFPDWRRIINECQRYSAVGKIDTGILTNFDDGVYKTLVEKLKNRDFDGMRKWVSENTDVDTTHLIRKLYNTMDNILNPQSKGACILILAKYQYQASFVADQEVNNVAMFTELMMECEFK